MVATQHPSRDAFIAYWKDYGVFQWRQLLWHFGYLGGLALYVFVVRRVDPDGWFLIASLVLAAAYLVLVPYLTIRRVHTKFARFIRCPQCVIGLVMMRAGHITARIRSFEASLKPDVAASAERRYFQIYDDSAAFSHALQRTPRHALGLFDNVWPAPRPAGAESLSLGR